MEECAEKYEKVEVEKRGGKKGEKIANLSEADGH